MADSIDKIRSDIAKMKEQIEEMKRERVARGLPAERPAKFVPLEIGYLLKERNRYVFDFLAKYTKLCDDAREIIPVDLSKLKDAKKEIKLLAETVEGRWLGIISGSILSAIKLIQNPGDVNPREYVRRLLLHLEMAKHGFDIRLGQLTYDSNLTTPENYKKSDEVRAKYERYKEDESLFNEELSKLYNHYESIKHLH
ncbi:hypothetical protein AABM38_10140 [Heyndrickxia sp. MSNUG]|uniref:hypothetical protein n=1 Tax=Heyndrickxia sp. MSNUG TaxID=3136677 RepID=UPI003C2F6BB3